MKYANPGCKSSVFLITRFNLALYPTDKNQNLTSTEEWLNDRFRLFEAYCFPSVVGQSDSDFIWLSLFDENTPPRFLGKIKEYENRMPNFVAVFLSKDETPNYADCVKLIIADLKDESNFLITTRVDNDDALHRDFIRSTKTLLKKQTLENCIYSFVNGIQYIETDNIAGKLRYIRNHFPIMITNNFHVGQPINHIAEINHSYIDNSGYDFCAIKGKAMWVEVVHHRNVANGVRLFLPVWNKYYMNKEFGLQVKTNILSTLVKYLLFSPVFLNIIFRGIKRRFSVLLK